VPPRLGSISARHLTENAVEVFGVLRFSDEIELQIHEIAVKARMSKWTVASAMRELRDLGLVSRRREGRVTYFSVVHHSWA